MCQYTRFFHIKTCYPIDVFFDQQFNTKKYIHFLGHSISFVDVTPVVLKSSIPIFIAPGWGETPKTFKDLMHLLFDAGFRVISVTHPRQDLKLITKSNISRLESQKAEIILTALTYLNVDKVNVVAHSEGAINAVIAAHMTPAVFKDILLVGPGGLVEHEGFLELASRFIGNIIQGGTRVFTGSVARAHMMRSGLETFKYFLMNPVMGLLEGSAISTTHLQNFLIDLHSHNISIGLILGTDDIVFPLKKMKSLTDLPWIDFHSVKGDHSDIYARPENYIDFFKKRFMEC